MDRTRTSDAVAIQRALIQVEPATLVMSVLLAPAADGATVLRLFNNSTRETEARVRSSIGIAQAITSDALVADALTEPPTVVRGEARLLMRPRQISTLVMR